MRGYWVLFHSDYCPVCGRSDDWQERVFDRPKPADDRERYVFREVYDWCDC